MNKLEYKVDQWIGSASTKKKATARVWLLAAVMAVLVSAPPLLTIFLIFVTPFWIPVVVFWATVFIAFTVWAVS